MLIIGAAIILVVCGLLSREWPILFGAQSEGGKGPTLGRITRWTNDTRLRTRQDFVWSPARDEQRIHTGDAMFTGTGSTASVALDHGGEITLRENSLVFFEPHEGTTLPNLYQGDFRLRIDGTLKLAMNGHVTSFGGAGTEISLKLDSHRPPVVRVFKGNLRVAPAVGAAREYAENQVVALDEHHFDDPVRSPANTVEADRPIPRLDSTELLHNWVFDDMYTRKVGQPGLEMRTVPSPSRVVVPLRWSRAEIYPLIHVQVSSRLTVLEPITRTINDREILSLPVALGLNHVRISTDQTEWSAPLAFTVTAAFNARPPPAFTFDQSEFTLDHDRGWVVARTKMSPDVVGVIYQFAPDETFTAPLALVQSSTDGELRIAVEREGELFVRAQFLLPSQELSGWSPVQSVRINARPAPPAPTGCTVTSPIAVEALIVADCAIAGADARYWITDHSGRTVHISRGLVARLKLTEIGTYLVRAAAINRDGVEGPPSAAFELLVTSPLPKQEPVPPASIALSAARPSVRVRPPELTPLESAAPNLNFGANVLSLDVAFMRAESTRQIYSNQPAGVSLGLAARVLAWFRGHGAEVRVRAPGAPLANDLGVTDVDVRYRYRWSTTKGPWMLRATQVSPYLGLRWYRARRPQDFSPRYELVTTGLRGAAAFGARWSTEGELGFGLGAATSQLLEGRLALSYHLSASWAINGASSLTFFEAKAPRFAPANVAPNREGNYEISTGLDYKF